MPESAAVSRLPGVTQDVGRYLGVLVEQARAVLGDELVGGYAAGSIALGAFEPDRSDIDVALVTRGPLGAQQKEQLVARLRQESLECPARGLELVVYRREVAGRPSPDAGFELELNTGPRMTFRATFRPEDRPEHEGHFWYGLDRCILHERGVALSGPPAQEVFTPPLPADVNALLRAALRWWIDRTPAGAGPGHAADDAVLGACRALVWQRSGEWPDKIGAGRRLLEAGYGPRQLIEQAIAARSGGPPPSGDDARAFQERVLEVLSAQAR